MYFKKITFLLLISSSSALMGMQELTQFERVAQELNHSINMRKIGHLDEGAKLVQEMSRLTQEEKNTLLKQLCVSLKDCYQVLQLYTQLLVLAGANVNINLGTDVFGIILRESLLQKAVAQKDVKMTTFLLQYQASTTDIDYTLGPLLYTTESYPVAALLVKYDALKPYIDNKKLQRNLLLKNFYNYCHDYELTLLYKYTLKKDYGVDLNFAVTDSSQNTLLHELCSNSDMNQITFFEKLRILLQEKVVNLQARNNNNQRPIDIVNSQLAASPNKHALLFAQKLLTDLENDSAACNILTRKNQEKQAN